MRGIPSFVTDVRKKVFTEVAKMAYEGDYSRMEELPYCIVPGEIAAHRESIFLSEPSPASGCGWRWDCHCGRCRSIRYFRTV